MRRFLMLSPYFPPMGVVGTKRPLMLARHLPRFGWEPVVLAADPDRENRDPILARAVPPSLHVSYAYDHGLRRPRPTVPEPKSREPRPRLLGRDLPHVATFLDRYVPDIPAAVRAAERLIRAHGLRAIHVNADPWSAMLAGAWLRRRTGLPLILDLRDPWSLHPGKRPWRLGANQHAIEALEHLAFRAADRIILNTEDAHAAYVAHYRDRIPAARFTWLRNAFDVELFQEPEKGSDPFSDPRDQKRGQTPFLVVHLGYFRRLVPARPLFEAFARFVRRDALPPTSARLLCLGGLREEDGALARELGIDDYLDARTVSYPETLSALRRADVLAVVIDPGSKLCMPSKVYDYLAAERPILALTPEHEIGRVLQETKTGLVVPLDDPDRAAAALASLCASPPTPDRAAIANHSARAQAERFAAILDAVTESSARPIQSSAC